MNAKQIITALGVPKNKYHNAHAQHLATVYKMLNEIIKGVYSVEKRDTVVEFGKSMYSGRRRNYNSGFEMDGEEFTIKTITGGVYVFCIPKNNKFHDAITKLLDNQTNKLINLLIVK